MRWIIASAICAALAMPAPATAAPCDSPDGPTAAVCNYVRGFMARTNARRQRAAVDLVPLIVATADAYGVDPVLVAVLASYESSYRPEARGSRGEVGLLQVWGVATWGFDCTTTEGALAAGVAWLRRCLDQSGGDVLRGVNLYATGRTGAKITTGSKLRFAAYKREKQK